jgi:ADP-ribose pyrophosphatase YjhB (NUDIX family)
MLDAKKNVICYGRIVWGDRMAAFGRNGMEMSNYGNVLRYCPRCGAAALKSVGLKLVRCGACGFELYINIAAAVAALIPDDQGQLLITTRGKEPKKGTWDLPGGFADPDESAETALKREILEELRLDVVSMQYLCSFPNRYDYMGVRYPTMDLGFICQVADLSVLAAERSEISQVSFVPLKEIDPARFGFSSIAKMVECYRTAVT